MHIRFAWFLLVQVLLTTVHALPAFVRNPQIDNGHGRLERRAPTAVPEGHFVTRAVQQESAFPQQANIYAAQLNATGGWIAYMVQVPGNPNGVFAYSQASIAQTASLDQDEEPQVVLAPAFVKQSRRAAVVTYLLANSAATVTALQLNSNGTITYHAQVPNGNTVVLSGAASVANIDQSDPNYPLELILLLTLPEIPLVKREEAHPGLFHRADAEIPVACSFTCPEGSSPRRVLHSDPQRQFCSCDRTHPQEISETNWADLNIVEKREETAENLTIPIRCDFVCPDGKSAATDTHRGPCSCPLPSFSSIKAREDAEDEGFMGLEPCNQLKCSHDQLLVYFDPQYCYCKGAEFS